MSKEILVPVDGSEHSFKALDIAASLASSRGMGVVLMHVIPDNSVPDGIAQWASVEHISDSPSFLYEQAVADNILSAAELHARESGVDLISRRVVEHGDPAKRITEVAVREQPEMIVMSTRGLSDLQGLVMGSVAHKVSHLAPCTVVTVT